MRLSVPEVRKLLVHALRDRPHDLAAVWRWSLWRRRHQFHARRCHYRARGALPPDEDVQL